MTYKQLNSKSGNITLFYQGISLLKAFADDIAMECPKQPPQNTPVNFIPSQPQEISFTKTIKSFADL